MQIYKSFTNHYTSVSFGETFAWNLTKKKKWEKQNISVVRDSEVEDFSITDSIIRVSCIFQPNIPNKNYMYLSS